MSTLLAFHTSDSDDPSEEADHKIVFAASEEQAWESRGHEGVAGCWRAPEFDRYAPGPVSNLTMLEHGWWFECTHCGQRVDNSGERWNDDTGEDEELDPVGSGDDVYCTPTCRARHFAEIRARRALRAALVELVVTRYPDATKVDRVNPYPADSHGLSEHCSVDFWLPGLTYYVTWRADGFAYVHPVDVEPFNARYGRKDDHAQH